MDDEEGNVVFLMDSCCGVRVICKVIGRVELSAERVVLRKG